jgi:hypothetical protein
MGPRKALAGTDKILEYLCLTGDLPEKQKSEDAAKKRARNRVSSPTNHPESRTSFEEMAQIARRPGPVWERVP